MDKVIIEELEVYAYHGVAEEEKKLGQKFIVSVSISADLEPAALSDRVEDSINYVNVCNLVRSVLLSEKYDLIETVAIKVIEAIFHEMKQAETVTVMIKKPWAPIGQPLNHAAVEMQRHRGDRNAW